jgi:hypothetical protein
MLGFITVVGPGVPSIGTVAEPRPVTVDMTDKLAFNAHDSPGPKGETIRFILDEQWKDDP